MLRSEFSVSLALFQDGWIAVNELQFDTRTTISAKIFAHDFLMYNRPGKPMKDTFFVNIKR